MVRLRGRFYGGGRDPGGWEDPPAALGDRTLGPINALSSVLHFRA